MTLIIRLAEPKNDKEQMFRLEVPIEDEIKKPGIAHVVLAGQEYTVEVYY